MLTEQRLHTIALDSRKGLRDCLSLIELHGGDREKAYLNPYIVVSAVSTWERFAVDLACASTQPGWTAINTDWDGSFDSKGVPWPGSRADREYMKTRSLDHSIDHVLIEAGVLAAPLTDAWRLHIATWWTGQDPERWRWTEYNAAPHDTNRDIIRQAMLGAKTARDAAAHRLYYKLARRAEGYSHTNTTEDQIDQRDWCYVWQSDNTEKKNSGDDSVSGRPTIQHGYARGVAALVIQLVDICIDTIREHHDWHQTDSQLPSAWFQSAIPSGPCAGMTLWNGLEITRHLAASANHRQLIGQDGRDDTSAMDDPRAGRR